MVKIADYGYFDRYIRQGSRRVRSYQRRGWNYGMRDIPHLIGGLYDIMRLTSPGMERILSRYYPQSQTLNSAQFMSQLVSNLLMGQQYQAAATTFKYFKAKVK